ncbi:MAG: T9SS type A sorting domain-containing protein [Bacteroidetes bacterium]|nr:T9SS type A sorting domain-containing protein [Bacteroidota bacterium]
MNEVKDAPFSFYPNPANDKVILKFSNITDVVFTLDLLSVDGRMITSFQLSQNEAKNGYELNTTSLPNGNYLINVNTSKGNFSSPILIRHN